MPTVHGQGRCKKGLDCSNGGNTYGTGKRSPEMSRSTGPGHEGRGRTEEIEGRSEFADCGGKSWRQIGVAFGATTVLQKCLIVTDSD